MIPSFTAEKSLYTRSTIYRKIHTSKWDYDTVVLQSWEEFNRCAYLCVTGGGSADLCHAMCDHLLQTMTE